jgi:hypothetical protein
MTVKQDLKTLQKEFKELSKKLEKLIAAAEKSEKPKSAKKITAKRVRAKTTKRSATQKEPAKKKTAQQTSTDQVLRIIKRSKKGVNATTLMEKTGFDLKKVRNILQRTYKRGKIKRADRGIYIAA